MFYFIPSWYNSDQKWHNEAPIWYRVLENMTFDDTVSQVRMFQNADEEVRLLLFSYNPQLRYMLHEESMLAVSYWSFFDDIQNIQQKEIKLINFKELNWPKGTYFVYTPFLVLAKHGGEIIARIQFAENGNLLLIELLIDGVLDKIMIFDDRGFVSSIKYFKQNRLIYQDYLNQNGVWQIREYASKFPRIVVNPMSDKVFNFTEYDDWDTLIRERILVLKKLEVTPDDYIIVAVNDIHNNLVRKSFPDQKKIFSFFGERYSFDNRLDFNELLDEGELFIAESEKIERLLITSLQEKNYSSNYVENHISRIPPFDTRLRLGQSQNIEELIAYLLVDDLSQTYLSEVLDQLLAKMEVNPSLELKIVSYKNDYDMTSLKEQVKDKILSSKNPDYFFTSLSLEDENHFKEEQKTKIRGISFDIYTNENQIIDALDTARLVIDLRDDPDLYTQIAALSSGIPQINKVHTNYVEHQKNGWIISDSTELNNAIDYYFDGLMNWNKSLVYSVKKMGDYTSGKILQRWRKLLEKE